MIRLLILAALALLGCKQDKVERTRTKVTDGYITVAALRDEWLDQLGERSEMYGWPSDDDCDGLLWAGEASSGGAQVDLLAAERAPGEMLRTPYDPSFPERECFARGGSKSTISRDMLLGYMLGLLRTKDLFSARRLYDYGKAHDWMMGSPQGILTAVYFNPNMQALLARLIYVLSDKTDARDRHDAVPVYFTVKKDYEKHLQVLSIYLFGEMTRRAGKGYITQPMLDRLKSHAEAQPDDALFNAVLGQFTGDYSRAITLLEQDGGYTCPTYVRGHENYCLVHKILAASVIVD